jgi:hypothetical protein
MIPSSKSVLDLAETYLRESLAAGWKGHHPVAEVAEQHLDRGGTVSAKSTRPPKGHKILYPNYSTAASLGDSMLKSVHALDPKLRRAVELKAEGHTCEAIGQKMKVSRRSASELVNKGLVAGRMYLLMR